MATLTLGSEHLLSQGQLGLPRTGDQMLGLEVALPLQYEGPAAAGAHLNPE